MWLVVESGGDAGRVVQATGERWVIGRDPGSNLVVTDDRVSRQHAMLRVYADGRAELHDMGSANGTLVNGHRLTQPVLLQGNEVIEVGGTTIRTSVYPPSGDATRVGAVPPEASAEAPHSPSLSTIERVKLRRSVRTATVVGATAIVAVATLGVLFATGVLGGGGGGGDTPRPVSAVVDQVRPSTVGVVARSGDRGGTGTGWVLDAGAGLVVTNQHVVNAGEFFQVRVGDSTRIATVVASAPCDDIAVLRVTDTSGMVTLPLGSQSKVKEGDTVVAVGYPGSDSDTAHLTATTGVVSVVSTSFDAHNAMDVPNYPNIIQHDAAINPGNSGGPLVDMQGRLVGMNSAGTTERDGRIIQGQNYAVGVDRIAELLPGLRSGASRYWTGLGLDYEPASIASADGLPQAGLLVQRIVPGSPAAQTSFANPGLVTAVNGVESDGTLQSYCAAVRTGPPDAATFTVLPLDGSTTTTEIRVPFATTSPRG